MLAPSSARAETADSLELFLALEPEPARIVLSTGFEVEGLREIFGFESLSSLDVGSGEPSGTPGLDPVDLENLELKDRETNFLGTLGLYARTSEAAPLEASIDVDAGLGEVRRSLSAETFLAGRGGGLAELSLRDLLLFDREEDGTTSAQNILYLYWKPRLGESGWRLRTRGALDVSRTDESDLEVRVSQADSVGTDTTQTISLGFLDYQKLSVRLEVARWDLVSTSVGLELGRKWVEGDGGGSYEAASLFANQGWFLRHGSLDLDAEVERRRYLGPSSVLESYWEADLRARWMGQGEPYRLDGNLSAEATRYDPGPAEDEALGLLEDDRVLLETDLILRRRLIAEEVLLGEDALLTGMDLGLGAAAELLRHRDGEGDGFSLGARLETSARGGGSRMPWWFECTAEAGQRRYRSQGGAEALTEGASFSFSQTDHAYLELTAMGGGDLPWGLRWDGYLSWDQEWHDEEGDDARLWSFSFGLTKRWFLLGPH